MAITFDALQFVNQLEAAGIERTQATAFVDIVKQATDSSEITTKSDITLVKSEIRELKRNKRIRVALTCRANSYEMDVRLYLCRNCHFNS